MVAVRNVHVPSLFLGKLGFNEKIIQGYDDKELDNSAVPAAALAVARCAVSYTPEWQDTPSFDLKKYFQDGFFVSSTRQLRWKEGDKPVSGFFTIDTPSTKAVVGFASGKPCNFGELTISSRSQFAALYVTAIESKGTIQNAKSLLLVALGRARNSGMKFSPVGNELLAKGSSPILMEPICADFVWKGRPIQQVNILNHDGVRTGKTIQIQNNQFTLNGQVDQTPYYEILFQ